MSLAVGNVPVAIAVLLVIFLNALFALIQEMQAERAVEALSGYLPQHATVFRDGRAQVVEASRLVPGDVVLIEEASGSRPTSGCCPVVSRSTPRHSLGSRCR